MKTSIKYHTLKLVATAIDLFGIDYPKISSEALIKIAKTNTGYDDFGDLDFMEGLDQLIDSIKESGNLTSIGKFVFRGEAINLLSSRLAIYN